MENLESFLSIFGVLAYICLIAVTLGAISINVLVYIYTKKKKQIEIFLLENRYGKSIAEIESAIGNNKSRKIKSVIIAVEYLDGSTQDIIKEPILISATTIPLSTMAKATVDIVRELNKVNKDD